MAYRGDPPATYYSTGNAHLDSGPGVVYWILVCITTGDGTLRIRDGSDGDGEILATIKVDAGSPAIFPFAPPIPYERGLFVECVDHIQDYTIAFDHLQE